MNNLDVSPFRLSRTNALMRCVAPAMEHVFSLRAMERQYAGGPRQEQGVAFIDAVFRQLQVQVKSDDGMEKLIPKSGPLMIVANHPMGGIEGMALAQQVSRVRSDVKVLVNYHLSRITNLRELFIAVDPFARKSSPKNNVKGLREALKWLRSGGVLIVFPAGEVAQWSFSRKQLCEARWSASIGRLLRLSQAMVLPAHVSGRNSNLFYLSRWIHPRLRTALLPREVMNKAGSTIEIQFGNVIGARALSVYQEDVSLTNCLRMHVLRLAAQKTTASVATPAVIAEAVPGAVLEAEVVALGESMLLAQSDDLQVFAAPSHLVPNVLQEIGRLREITFRAVGEGTGKSIDIDLYDNYYHHLFIWDRVLKQVVGAYRLGLSEDILPKYGKKGFYTYSLFDYRTRFLRELGPAIELGRSFVRLEYQREFMPLMLLWRGIGQFVSRHLQYKMLFGPVSISGAYHDYSQRLMVEFLRENHFDAVRAKQVKARSSFHDDALSEEFRALLQWADINTVSRLVADMEDDGKGMPILLRQYLKLGGRMTGFNVDANFSNSLDALVIVDLSQTELRSLQRYMGKPEAEQFLQYHQALRDVNCLHA